MINRSYLSFLLSKQTLSFAATRQKTHSHSLLANLHLKKFWAKTSKHTSNSCYLHHLNIVWECFWASFVNWSTSFCSAFFKLSTMANLCLFISKRIWAKGTPFSIIARAIEQLFQHNTLNTPLHHHLAPSLVFFRIPCYPKPCHVPCRSCLVGCFKLWMN